MAITSCLMLSKFLQEYPPILATLQGEKITTDGVFFEHRDQLHNHNFSWPLKSDPKFLGLFENRNSVDFEPLTIFDNFMFINSQTGEIRVKDGAKKYLITQAGFADGDAQSVVNLAVKVSGYVVCWSRMPDEAWMRDFYCHLEASDTFATALDYKLGPMINPAGLSIKRPAGRPLKQVDAARVYWSIYTSGHEATGIGWKDALREVNKQLKSPVSEDTLKRAVSNTMPQKPQ